MKLEAASPSGERLPRNFIAPVLSAFWPLLGTGSAPGSRVLICFSNFVFNRLISPAPFALLIHIVLAGAIGAAG
jgi:hypothetical protein